MSGFIDQITYRDYDTFVHTSELGHFSILACGQKRVIENPPLERLSVLICCLGGGLIIF